MIDFEPLSKNSVLNNEGNIHINSNNYTNKFSETIGKLLGYISDYLYTDLNIREEEFKEINSKFISKPYKFQKKVRINNDLLCRRFTFWTFKHIRI